MKKECYWCRAALGEKEGQNKGGVFYSVCDKCALELRLDERLPELLEAIAALRQKNDEEENRTPNFFTDPSQKK